MRKRGKMGPAVVPNGRDYGAASMRKGEKSRSGGWGEWKVECGMQKKKDEEHRRVGGTWRRDELEIKTGEIKAASILVC